MRLTLPAPYDDRLLADEPLAKYTAARLGGPADYLYIARESPQELAAVVEAAWAQAVPVRILGGGANVLVNDVRVPGLVVVNSVSQAEFHADHTCDVSSGHGLAVLARKCAARALSGFEWAVSVPGTIGGAVVNNAGAHGGDMAGCLRTVDLLDAQSGRRTLTLADLDYRYRTSALKARADRRFLVLSARLAFTPDDRNAIEARMGTFIAHRKRTQPPGASLGSIFKNPPGDYAGRLIEACGLKGLSIGGAQVSPVHANLFINTGSASAADYLALVHQVQAEVARQTGVELETEIEVIGSELAD
ncbi:MAG: UDP-N-acetylmuramate dehydrogenase [Anaerolineae bacterium]|nr:UDP-N-acetylmuramate dehydrogenase [Anaerolineae bacterium]